MKLSRIFSKTKTVSKLSTINVIEKKQLQQIVGGTMTEGGPRQISTSDASAGGGTSKG